MRQGSQGHLGRDRIHSKRGHSGSDSDGESAGNNVRKRLHVTQPGTEVEEEEGETETSGMEDGEQVNTGEGLGEPSSLQA